MLFFVFFGDIVVYAVARCLGVIACRFFMVCLPETWFGVEFEPFVI